MQKILVQNKKSLSLLVTVLILALALFLRLRGLDSTRIWSDQSFTLNTAMRWVNGGDMPLGSNKSSVGFINPPMIEYLYALALRVWPDVLSVSFLTLISGMVAVLAASWGAYQVFGKNVAFWTLLVYAVNPWSVLYSQLIWNQTMVPIFSSLMLLSLLLYFVVDQRSIYLVLSFVWAACMTQVHPGSVVQLLSMGLIFVLFRRKLRLRPLVIGALIFLALYLPYVLYESGVGWADMKVIFGFGTESAPWSEASLLVSFDLLRAHGLDNTAAGVLFFDKLISALLVISLLYALWLMVSKLILRRGGNDQRRMAGLGIILIWFCLPILFYLRSASYLQVYYLISQFPTHFILIGLAVVGIGSDLRARWPRSAVARVAGWLMPAALLAVVIWQFGFNLYFQDVRVERPAESRTVREVRTAINASKQLLSDHPDCKLVVVSEGHSVESGRFSLLREFTVPERVLLTDGRLALPIPAPCAVYLDALPASRASQWLETTADLLHSDLDQTGSPLRFFSLPASQRAQLEVLRNSADDQASWQNGLALVDYAWQPISPGVSLPLRMVWTVIQAPAEQVFHFGTYLLSSENQVVTQSDGPGFDSIQWRLGDSFITWFDLEIPPELPADTYQVAVSLYTWPQVERVALQNGENTAYLETIVWE